MKLRGKNVNIIVTSLEKYQHQDAGFVLFKAKKRGIPEFKK